MTKRVAGGRPNGEGQVTLWPGASKTQKKTPTTRVGLQR